MIAVPGAWKNFEEIEEELSLPELLQILESYREIEHNRFRAMAALKGIDLDAEQNAEADFERVKRQAEARLRGVTEEQIELAQIGIAVEEF